MSAGQAVGVEVIGGTAAAGHGVEESDWFSQEREALLRIAALAADGTGEDEVFKAVAAEAAALSDAVGAFLIRFDGEREYTVVGSCAGPSPVGTRIAVSVEDAGLIGVILRTERVARVDSQRDLGEAGHVPDAFVGPGGVGVPLTVDNCLWGVLEVMTGSFSFHLSRLAARRLQHFAALVIGAVANAHARAELQSLMDERASLRRIHAVAGRGGTGADVLAAIAAEGSAWLGGLSTVLVRLEEDGTSTVIAASASREGPLVTESGQANEDDLIGRVARSAAPIRIDDAAQRSANEHRVPTSIGVPITIAGRTWGVFVATSLSRAMPPRAEQRLARFAEAVTPTILSAQARTQLTQEQFALRRVAELMARGAGADDVFAVVVLQASELARGADVTVTQWEGPDLLRVIAAHGATAPAVGMLLTADGQVSSVGNIRDPDGRVGDDDHLRDATPTMVQHHGKSLVAPIRLGGEPWGLLGATLVAGSFPVGTEHLLNQFADLAAAELANARARARIQELAEAQAALSRVAALVARGAALDEVFTAVATEASHQVEDGASVLVRFDTDSSFFVVGAANSGVPVGFRGQPHEGALLTELVRTGAPARVETFEDTPWAGVARHMEDGPTVAVPITVESRLWGALTVSSLHSSLPDNIENRSLEFAELAGAAIANAENKAKLTASRARVVATADETRRRLQRDVHDSAQQRLVHTILTLKLARQSIAPDSPSAALVDEALLNAERASNELRDIVRGILPAALTRGGLRLGLESLLSNVALPVDLHVTAPRCSTGTEQTAYFVVAEALTNVTKHAHAGRASVSVTLDGDLLTIEVHDDGIGGADPARGAGLIGLADRVDAVEGAFTLTSPTGGGTTLLVRLPARALQQPDR